MANQKGQYIRQTRLVTFLQLQAEIKQAKKAIAELEKRASDEEQFLIRACYTKLAVEKGNFALMLEPVERRNVKWKEEFARAQGPQAVQDVMDNAPVTIYEHAKVIAVAEAKEEKKWIPKSA